MEKRKPRPGKAVPGRILGTESTADNAGWGCCLVTEFNAQLIELLGEKIQRLEQEKDRQRKEINRLKRQIREMEKKANAKTD